MLIIFYIGVGSNVEVALLKKVEGNFAAHGSLVPRLSAPTHREPWYKAKGVGTRPGPYITFFIWGGNVIS